MNAADYLTLHYPLFATQIYLDYQSSSEPIEQFAKRRAASIARQQRRDKAKLSSFPIELIAYIPDSKDELLLVDLRRELGEEIYQFVELLIQGYKFKEIRKLLKLTSCEQRDIVDKLYTWSYNYHRSLDNA